LKLIKDRMKSVGSIKKITKAMKMVSAAKLRAVQSLLPAARQFKKGLSATSTMTEAPKDAKKVLVVAVTSDRGLCGSVNSAVARYCKAYNREHAAAAPSFFMVGEKGRGAIERECGKSIIRGVTEHNKRRPASFAICSVVAEQIMATPHDKLHFVYNKFKSAIAYELIQEDMYSLDLLQSSGNMNLYDYNYDGHKGEIQRDMHEFRLANTLFSCNIENGTSEQSSRVQAMENSSKNAGEMLAKLSLQYNKGRQAKITTELIEVISGSVASEEQ